MAEWSVKLPIAGYALVDVEADDEQSAIRTALEIVDTEHLETWEAMERTGSGNVTYLSCTRAEAERID